MYSHSRVVVFSNNLFLLNLLPQVIDFVNTLCHNSIVATTTGEKSQPTTFAGYKAGSGSYQQSKGDKPIMPYKDSLKPWAVTHLGQNLQWIIIARYKSRSDADGHLLLLRQRVPDIEFKVVFDLPDYKK
ncbi:MAG: hypothetical protein ABI417_18830 [Coleofasciculaceae cyanobacterium]